MIRFDYCTVAGKHPDRYAAHVDNVLRNAGLDRSMWEFYTIIYKNSKISDEITNAILKIAADNKIKTEMYYEVEGDDYETFLHNLYRCWDRCQTIGTSPLNMRAGSDQAFGRNAFKNMLECWDSIVPGWSSDCNKDGDLILFHNCIESKENVPLSRHILEPFGHSWDTFKEDEFQAWCDKNEVADICDFEKANKYWSAPKDIPGCPMNGSADGCSWLQSKELYRKFGPMLPRMEYGTGDITLIMRYRNAGIPIRICGSSTTYHLSRSGA